MNSHRLNIWIVRTNGWVIIIQVQHDHVKVSHVVSKLSEVEELHIHIIYSNGIYIPGVDFIDSEDPAEEVLNTRQDECVEVWKLLVVDVVIYSELIEAESAWVKNLGEVLRYGLTCIIDYDVLRLVVKSLVIPIVAER